MFHIIDKYKYLARPLGFGNVHIGFSSLSNKNMQAATIFAKRCQKLAKGLTT